MAKNLIPSQEDMDAPSESELLEEANDLLNDIYVTLKTLGEDNTNPLMQRIVDWDRKINQWLEAQ
jgi:hypothetical protein